VDYRRGRRGVANGADGGKGLTPFTPSPPLAARHEITSERAPNEVLGARNRAAFNGILCPGMGRVNDGPAGVRGWLLLLSRLLLIGEPINVAVTAPAALTALPIRGTPLALILLLRLAVAALGIAAGLALAGRHHGAVTMAKASLALSAATAVFVYTTPYFPNNRMPGDTPLYIAATLAYYSGWLAYLTWSRRVRNTYV